MSSIMMAIEGVLGTGGDFVTMLPNSEGIRLFRSLNREYQIQLVCSVDRPDQMAHWLNSQGIREYASAWSAPDELRGRFSSDGPVRAIQLRRMRSSRIPISMVVDTNAQFIAHAAGQGIDGMLYVPAAGASVRTDLTPTPIRPWEEMTR